MRIDGMNFVEAVVHLAGEPVPAPLPVRQDTYQNPLASPCDNQPVALTVFAEATNLGGSISEQYLLRRIGKQFDRPGDLRFHPKCGSYFGDERRWEHHPALIALARDICTNEPRAIHRTFLLPDGSDRLRCKGGKKALGPTHGCVVKLSPDDNVTTGLHLTEGIETGLSILAANIAPVWVTLGTSVLAKFPVLPGIECLTIFSDHDTNGASRNAAQECAIRWHNAGREVVFWTPGAAGTDWNDALRGAA